MAQISDILWLDRREARAEESAHCATIALAETPLGVMTLVQRGERIVELRLNGERFEGETVRDTPLTALAAGELAEYFAGKRKSFTVPLAAVGTPFQLSVWRALADIPYGETVSYGELARRAGNPAATRAVGMANHNNPLPVFIPCHRVIGANGKLVGYGGGLEKKESLLKLEAENRA
jgi:methylated-DNA-[protein]-cysteine S-methyltransferase